MKALLSILDIPDYTKRLALMTEWCRRNPGLAFLLVKRIDDIRSFN